MNTATVLQCLDGRALTDTLKRYRELSLRSGLPPTCIVKTATGVRYKNVVSTVDAITLAGIPHYSVQDSLVEGERALLAHRGAP